MHNLLKELVGASGFEPPASWSRTRRSTRLSHAPKMRITLGFQMPRKTRRSSHLPLGNHMRHPKSIRKVGDKELQIFESD
jgi:hypothetical protein